MRRFFILLYIAMLTCGMRAAGVGTWRLFLSYSNIEQIEASGTDVYVKASGNLYSYHLSDGTVQTHDKTNGLTNSDITHIAWVPSAKKLLIIYSDYLFDLLDANGNVTSMTALRDYSTNKSKTVREVRTSGRYAYVVTAVGTMKIDARDEYVVETYKEGTTVPDLPAAVTKEQGPNGSLTYDSTNRCYWGANAEGKLTKYAKAEDGTFTAQTSGVGPDGPKYNEHYFISYNKGKIYSVRGVYDVNTDGNTPGGVQVYDKSSDSWTTYDESYLTGKSKNYVASTSLAIDPRNENHVMVAAKSGLFDYRNGKLEAFYDVTTDGPIKSAAKEGLPEYSVITSAGYDDSGNLWMFNMSNINLLCLTKDGQWNSYAHTEFLVDNSNIRAGGSFFDSRKLMWFYNKSWTVAKFGLYDTATDKMYVLTSPTNQDGNDLLANYNTLMCVTEDKEGNIWFGTTGSGPFYLSRAMITEMRNSTDMSGIYVTQHKVARNDGSGLADYLLSTVSVNDIKVDEANRKWFATTDGVYLISSDNNEQVYHFTTDNSPLPSNDVKSIALDDAAGKVYFGTMDGLCSYQSDVNENYGDMSDDNMYAYPNPVEPDYNGYVTIVGLTDGCQVKIATASGYVVHSGRVSGGSYQWNLRDATGNRVASGVYQVLVADSEGNSGTVTKIAVVK